MGKHIHKFRTWGFCGKEAEMRCDCGEQIKRPQTARERYEYDVLRWLKEPGVHKIWFDFEKRFCPRKKDGTQPWKMKGWKLMCAIEKWAKKYPKDVRITGCDDSSYMGSDIVLIEHRVIGSWKKAQYHGTSMIFVPQNGEEPCRVFLYPGHNRRLTAALVSIRKEAEEVEKREQKRGLLMNVHTGRADEAFLKKRSREEQKRCLGRHEKRKRTRDTKV